MAGSINQREMLDPAGKRDEATHHAVKNWAINSPNFRGGKGVGMTGLLLRKAFDAHNL